MSRSTPTPALMIRRLATITLVFAVGTAGACTSNDPDVEAGDAASTDSPDTDVESPTDDSEPGDDDSAVATDTTTTEVPPTTESTTTTAPPPTTAPPTTAPPTTAAPEPEPDPDTWKRGSEGPQVTAIQNRLVELGFHVPVVDGTYGSITQQAVLAFQKGAGLSRDGVAGPQTMAALDTATPIGPREGGDHIEIDLSRQLMFLVRGGETFIFNTSTGTSGWETPPGRFTITREIDGMRHAPLGDLWRPKYFNGGIALHGSGSIPGYPASHGCARLHNDIINMIWDQGLAPVGTPVWVY